MKVTCPHCGHQTRISDEFANQSGECVRCGETFTVPPPPGMPGYTPTKDRSSVIGMLVVGFVLAIGLSVVLSCCLGVNRAFWTLF